MSATRSTSTVGDVMTPDVVTCPPETPLASVAELMADRRIHCVVVFTDEAEGAPGRHWGVVSDLDLAASIDDLETRTAGTAATTPVVMIMPDQPVRRAAELMTQYRTAHLIVVETGSTRPIGVISTLDVARAVASLPAR